MALTPYKANQGLYARGAAGAALLLLALFATVRFTQSVEPEKAFDILGLAVNKAAIWGGALFVVLGALTAFVTFGFATGIAGVDTKVHGFVDLLIETQGELQKVSWPSKDELRRSTIVVLVTIGVLGCFLFVVDLIINYVMTQIGVLPS